MIPPDPTTCQRFAGRRSGCKAGDMTGLDLLDDEQRASTSVAPGGRRTVATASTSIDPADGSVLCSMSPTPSPTDAIDALDAAVAAQHDWARTAPRERGEILRRAFGLLTERADDFAHLMSLEMGKTVAEAKGEVAYGVGVLPLVLRGGGAHPRPLDAGPRRRQPAADHQASRSARACSSPRGTSRSRWAPARSARPSRPAARWWSSPPPRRRCRCSRWPRCSRRRACRRASSTSSPPTAPARSEPP